MNVMTQIEKDVLQVMQGCTNRVSIPTKGDGWVNLANLGLELRRNGIDYSRLGFDKLITFMKSLRGVELFRDESKTLPVIFVREGSVDSSINEKNNQSSDMSLTNPSQLLMNWAFMGYIPTKFSRLKKLALEEDWGTIEGSDGKRYYPKNDKGEEYYPILYNYLTYTFFKLYCDKNIYYSKYGNYAVFNTGLVDIRYKQIYALFGKNKNQERNVEWYLIDFCIEGEDPTGKTLVAQFEKMPPVAHYFRQVTDLLYDTNIKPILDYEHIIVENVDRLPADFINANAPRGFDIQDTRCMSGDNRKAYYNSLRQAIRNDPESYRQMTDRLDSALTVSIERVKWNFKSAIPMYYPKKNIMCLFLPLCLVKDNKVDIALVVEKTPSGRYQGSTIYKLGWAYKCARLVCRPDSDWLTVSVTNSTPDDVEDID